MKVREIRIGAAVLTTDAVSLGRFVASCSCGWTTRDTAELGVEAHARNRHGTGTVTA